MKKLLCLPLSAVAVVAFFAVMAVLEALVVSGFLSIFEGFSRALVYTVYGVAGIFAAVIGYLPLALVDQPSRLLRGIMCVFLIGLAVAFFVVVAPWMEREWQNPTRGFAIALGLGALIFVGLSGDDDASSSDAPPSAPSSGAPEAR